MSKRVADQSSDTSDFKDPKLGWIIAFLFVVSFLGLFSVVPLRKVCQIPEILTAVFINFPFFYYKLMFHFIFNKFENKYIVLENQQSFFAASSSLFLFNLGKCIAK